MGRRDLIFGHFGETALCRDEQHGGGICCAFSPQLVEKVDNVDQNSRSHTAMTVSKLSTESVGSRRDLVANCLHTADADATQLDSCVASAVCIGL